MADTQHKAGFVSIVGKPNVGKSTLMNALVGEKLSIITSKAQTTRHRIMGILNGDDFQIVYSDTPGIIKPQYALHESMMGFVRTSLEDADVILFVTDIYEKHDEDDVIKRLQHAEVPILLLINKIDQATEEEVNEKVAYWQEVMKPTEIHPISALHNFGLEQLFSRLLHYLPVHPAFYPKDELTDKPERFFVSEIIREKILLNYKKEIPYSCEVVIEEFKEEEAIIRIRAEISVERRSQKGIVIGHKGEALKKVGMQARVDMEDFFQKKVFLDLYVRVNENWRTDQKLLRRFGYSE
ncbi:GTP-binding protein Era [Pontibacter aydingkolensis]|uniref:GTPase Era n=1 Tax=Pontibacter aydingkolensis TaxID=1911536 RepID=A0ABS7CWY9_9BACT|nr:GTPase Era [Pontibacter aydingkolensis]MBW7468298.1 GTPase Era [Pontibacter aydingkolensis]